MTVKVQVNEISRESYKGKDGTQKSVTRLVLVDKDGACNNRFKGDLVMGIPSHQIEHVEKNVRRDDNITVELHGVRIFGTQFAFEGEIVVSPPATEPSKAGPKA